MVAYWKHGRLWNLIKEALDMDLGMILLIIGIILVIVGIIILYFSLFLDKFVFVYFGFVVIGVGGFCIFQALISFQIIIT